MAPPVSFRFLFIFRAALRANISRQRRPGKFCIFTAVTSLLVLSCDIDGARTDAAPAGQAGCSHADLPRLCFPFCVLWSLLLAQTTNRRACSSSRGCGADKDIEQQETERA